MKNSRRKLTFDLIFAAMTAALYVILTIFSAFFNLAYGGMQFRISEALCILPAFNPAAIVGLTVGCIISNFFSPMMLLDVLFGSVASLIAALLGYLLRRVTYKGLPVLVPLPAVLVNGLFVALEISVFTKSWVGFGVIFLGVALGQLVCCYGLGLPLYAALKRVGFERLIQKHSVWGGNIK